MSDYGTQDMKKSTIKHAISADDHIKGAPSIVFTATGPATAVQMDSREGRRERSLSLSVPLPSSNQQECKSIIEISGRGHRVDESAYVRVHLKRDGPWRAPHRKTHLRE